MANSDRGWHTQQSPLPPPPPPYEVPVDDRCSMDDSTTRPTSRQQAPQRRRSTIEQLNYAHLNDYQTIPKTAHHHHQHYHHQHHNRQQQQSGYQNHMMMMTMMSSNEQLAQSISKTDHNSSKRNNQVKTYNHTQHQNHHQDQPRLPCAHQSNRKHSLSPPPPAHRRNDNHEQFVRSLAAPKSFWAHVSVEPLAFLAIVALYIEFPSIQDLIWTKICLEVISKYPDLGEPAQSIAYQSSSFGSKNNSTINGLASGNLTMQATNQTLNQLGTNPLPADGRIQQSDNTTYLVVPHHHATNNYDDSTTAHRRQHVLCDRQNKRAFPADIKQEIIDVDSLFWLKYQILICSLSLLASPYWGGLSDRIGRLIPMNVPVFAAILCNTISLVFGLLISLSSHSLIHIEWLYLGAIIVGLSGGQTVLIMNMFSFISDNTTNEERSGRVTILESVIFLAHSLGFFLSKKITLLGLDPPNRPWLNRHFVAFSAAVALNIMCLLYSFVKLRHHKFHRFLNNFEREQQEATILGSNEQIVGRGSSPTMGVRRAGGSSGGGLSDLMVSAQMNPGERLRELTSNTPDDPDGPIARSDKSNWSFRDSMITLRYYRETYEIATKRRDSRTIILLLLLSGFISSLSLAVLMSLLFLYSKMDPFNWNTSRYSWWNSISSITRGIALVSLTVSMRFVSGWSVPDPIVAALGFLAKGAGLLTIGLAQSTNHLNMALIPLTFSEYTMPPIRSLLSKLVAREELGKIYSCLGVSQSVCFILSNIAFYVAFTIYANQYIFRLSFILVAGIEFGAVILLLIIYTAIRRQMPQLLL
uniref:Proton-coupled folate transporter n=1 Tax=Aceria tosichella TaxID=561515 RepID=A0A6G1S8E9_9ACAR